MGIKVALIGVGNCASSLVQAVEAAKKGVLKVGVSHKIIGSYKVEDIEFSAAFDVDERKVNMDISEAIFEEPNCTTRYIEVSKKNVYVSCGKLLDGISSHMTDIVRVSNMAKQVSIESIIETLKNTHTDVVVSYLPVGSNEAAEFYARAAAEAGCGFINCMPSKIATSEMFQKLFKEKQLPLLGDDIKSQIGSTAIHRAIIDLLQKKGAQIDRTYQLNIGGNTDFKNMRDSERSKTKKHTKEASLKCLFKNDVDLGVGPSDYVPHLKDFKVGYIQIEGTSLLGMPFSIDLKLKVEDSPNSAGVAINAIRSIKYALDKKRIGVLNDICPYFFKNPPIHEEENKLFQAFENFVV